MGRRFRRWSPLLLLLLSSWASLPTGDAKKRRQLSHEQKEARRRRKSGQRERPSVASPGALSADECARIVGTVREMALLDSGAVTAPAGMAEGTVRTSDVAALPREKFDWVYARMRDTLERANAEAWGFSALGKMEGIQIARYDGAKGGHYTWHPDAVVANQYESARSSDFGGQNRLLSASVQLSGADAYSGGDVQIAEANVTRDIGAVVVFPSYQLHRVFPVTAGERWSLVVWLRGADKAGEYWNDARRSYRALQRSAAPGLAMAALSTLATVYSHLDRAAESIPLYEKALALEPSDPTVLSNQADSYTRIGKDADAIRVHTKALVAHPAQLWSLRGRGSVLLRQERHAEAAADLERATELAPGDEVAQLSLGLSLFGLVRSHRGDASYHAPAIEALSAAVALGRLDPASTATAHVGLAKLHASRPKKIDMTAALAAADAAVGATQDAPSLGERAAQECSGPQCAAEAERALSHAREDALRIRALLRRKQGMNTGALEDYRALAALVPSDPAVAKSIADLSAALLSGGRA